MKIENITKFCDHCKHKIFDPKSGVVCAQTAQKPDFDETCPIFEETEKSKYARQYIAENPVDPNRESVKTSSGPDAMKGLVFGLILVVLGIGLTLFSESNALDSGRGSYTIYIGLIVIGAFRILFSGKF
jgi:hypothetical protein|tara:strand:+ start:13044 stop:13430 length:387 start_codon:yes stop_codon:yes gene_type:complete